MNIAYDFDGVLNNLPKVWVNYLIKKFALDKSNDIKFYSMALNFPEISKNEILKPLKTASFWKKVDLIENSVKYMNKLKKAGHNIFIVTATNAEYWTIKYKHCFKKLLPDFPEENIILTHRKDLIKADILIDDNPEYLSLFDGYRILYNASYNNDYPKSHYDICVQNHEELYNKILNYMYTWRIYESN